MDDAHGIKPAAGVVRTQWLFRLGNLANRLAILGFRSNGTIVSWLPLFLFVVLFGLSMDYHVFILSRVREAVDRGEPTEVAVRRSIALTAGVVTAAAVVMVCVFALFGTLSSLELQQAGVGLAAAVLIDATVIALCFCPRR